MKSRKFSVSIRAWALIASCAAASPAAAARSASTWRSSTLKKASEVALPAS